TSPCVLHMQGRLDERLQVQEPVAFAHDHLLARLDITPLDERVAVHVTCSSTHMGLGARMVALAQACAREVVVPAEITCCGFAGDKGLVTPELNASALKGLAEQVGRSEERRVGKEGRSRGGTDKEKKEQAAACVTGRRDRVDDT